MAKKFVRTTKQVWDNKQDKSQYNDSIVFIEDSKQIWSNGNYYINSGPQVEQDMDCTFVAEYEDNTKTLVLNSNLVDSYYNTEFINVTNTVMELEPNKYYYWSEPVNTLTITLKEPLNTNILNIYTFEFTTSESGCTLLLQDTVKWSDGVVPTIAPSITYQISITNNLAMIQGFTYAK